MFFLQNNLKKKASTLKKVKNLEESMILAGSAKLKKRRVDQKDCCFWRRGLEKRTHRLDSFKAQ